MVEQYDGKLFFRNVEYLIKQQKRKIGEVEREAGVSAGYISRTSKARDSKASIDFIMNVARILGVNLDTLLMVDLSRLNATETYLLPFLTKLINDTTNDLLTWKREDAAYLNVLASNGSSEHPLFTRKEPEVLSDGTCKSGDYAVFKSNSFGWNTKVCEECYNIQLKNGACLYIMSIERAEVPGGYDPKNRAKEIWLTMNGHKPEFLCGDWGKAGKNLASVVDALYKTVQASLNRPKIDQDCRDIIDAYMNDDVKDDAPGTKA